MKKLLIAGLASVFILILGLVIFYNHKKDHLMDAPDNTAIETVPDGEDSITLALALDDSEDSVYGRIAKTFAEKVKEQSSGNINIDIYFSMLLGKSKNLLDDLDSDYNPADIVFVSFEDLNDAGCSEIGKMIKPYAYKNYKDFNRWATSKKAKKILNEPNETGLGAEGLFYCADTFYQLYKSSDNNLSGKKISLNPDDLSSDYAKKLKAESCYYTFIEIRDAVNDESIAGVELLPSVYIMEELWDVLPYVVNDHHRIYPDEVLLTLNAKAKLGDKNVDLLKKAGNDTIKEYASILQSEEDDLLKELESYGAHVISK